MIEVLSVDQRGTCAHCDRAITRFARREEWTHDPEPGQGVFQRHCPDSPIATPREAP